MQGRVENRAPTALLQVGLAVNTPEVGDAVRGVGVAAVGTWAPEARGRHALVVVCKQKHQAYSGMRVLTSPEVLVY